MIHGSMSLKFVIMLTLVTLNGTNDYFIRTQICKVNLFHSHTFYYNFSSVTNFCSPETCNFSG